jgi:hypothetical protein
MIEGSESGFIFLTRGSGSGSRRPKNIWIRRIRIRNTGGNPNEKPFPKFEKLYFQHPKNRLNSVTGYGKRMIFKM